MTRIILLLFIAVASCKPEPFKVPAYKKMEGKTITAIDQVGGSFYIVLEG